MFKISSFILGILWAPFYYAVRLFLLFLPKTHKWRNMDNQPRPDFKMPPLGTYLLGGGHYHVEPGFKDPLDKKNMH